VGTRFVVLLCQVQRHQYCHRCRGLFGQLSLQTLPLRIYLPGRAQQRLFIIPTEDIFTSGYRHAD
jgi:hypothetical protein